MDLETTIEQLYSEITTLKSQVTTIEYLASIDYRAFDGLSQESTGLNTTSLENVTSKSHLKSVETSGCFLKKVEYNSKRILFRLSFTSRAPFIWTAKGSGPFRGSSIVKTQKLFRRVFIKNKPFLLYYRRRTFQVFPATRPLPQSSWSQRPIISSKLSQYHFFKEDGLL